MPLGIGIFGFIIFFIGLTQTGRPDSGMTGAALVFIGFAIMLYGGISTSRHVANSNSKSRNVDIEKCSKSCASNKAINHPNKKTGTTSRTTPHE